MMVVHLSGMVFRCSWMYSSVSMSTAEVVSSRISTGACFAMARARETRCFWPPERPVPRSPTMVSYFSVMPEMNSSASAITAEASTFSTEVSGTP